MLVHKRTMGVLTYRWTGQYRKDISGVKTPVFAPWTLADVPDPGEWWEVPGRSVLGRRLRACYPFADPVIGDGGALVDIVPWSKARIYGEPPPAPPPPKTDRRRPRRRKYAF